MELSRYSGRYALTELLVCGQCGSPYKRVTWTASGNKRIVWRCTSRLTYGKKYCADSPTIPEEALQTAVLAALNNAMADQEQMIGILDESLTAVIAEKNEGSASPTVIRNRIQLLEKSMAELLPIIGRSDNPEAFDEQMKAISDEIAALQASLEEQVRQSGSDEFSRQLDDIRTALQNAPFEICEYNDNVVRQMIDTIRVLDDNRVQISFKGGYEVEQPINNRMTVCKD
jgi:site-specific DNA recombinase